MLELNPSFEKLTGISAEAALSGKTIREVVPNLEEGWFEVHYKDERNDGPTRNGSVEASSLKIKLSFKKPFETNLDYRKIRM